MKRLATETEARVVWFGMGLIAGLAVGLVVRPAISWCETLLDDIRWVYLSRRHG